MCQITSHPAIFVYLDHPHERNSVIRHIGRPFVHTSSISLPPPHTLKELNYTFDATKHNFHGPYLVLLGGMTIISSINVSLPSSSGSP